MTGNQDQHKLLTEVFPQDFFFAREDFFVYVCVLLLLRRRGMPPVIKIHQPPETKAERIEQLKAGLLKLGKVRYTLYQPHPIFHACLARALAERDRLRNSSAVEPNSRAEKRKTIEVVNNSLDKIALDFNEENN